jgi:hypothetical protein
LDEVKIVLPAGMEPKARKEAATPRAGLDDDPDALIQ